MQTAVPQLASQVPEVLVVNQPYVNPHIPFTPATSVPIPAAGRPTAPETQRGADSARIPVVVPVLAERQVMPVMSPQLRQLLPARPIVIEVKVRISETGSVTDVETEAATGVAAHLGR